MKKYKLLILLLKKILDKVDEKINRQKYSDNNQI